MATSITKVVFEITAQAANPGRFTIPEDVLAALGITDINGVVYLEIWGQTGSLEGDFQMVSNREVYEASGRNPGLRSNIGPGDRLLITASRARGAS
ncbi:MAG: hypothetical protein LH650_00995 [Chloroflexi bacterium]|nr:hypothetical protein [Chloroflexota bacterium]